MTDYGTLLTPPPATPQPTLTEAEVSALQQLKAHFPTGYELDGKPLTEREMIFLSQETLLRYWQATEHNVAAALGRLEGTLRWRRSMDLDDIDKHAGICEPETQYGTRFLAGWSGQYPVNYTFLNRNPLPNSERRQEHNLFMFERAVDLLPAGCSKVVSVMNFGGKRAGPATPAIGLTQEFLGIVGEHYPLMTKCTLLQDMNFIARTFVNAAWPFIDAKTKETTKTKSGAAAIKDGDIEAAGLIKDCGGQLDFTYDHATYWPLLIETCKARRAAVAEKWRGLGEPEVGRAERLFR